MKRFAVVREWLGWPQRAKNSTYYPSAAGIASTIIPMPLFSSSPGSTAKNGVYFLTIPPAGAKPHAVGLIMNPNFARPCPFTTAAS
ncbi:hypothetical protein [Candidatus Electronema sp. JM]|uniref:hypothetical protein n=1 Tax=Candidatus Electronema sp. JM TaxID=3401571 RepID=UPI003AA80AE4